MKKSYLIFLLCLLFCGQMFAQTFDPPTPTNPENSGESGMTDVTEDNPVELHDPCEANYEIKIENIIWGATYWTLVNMVPENVHQTNFGELPKLFNIVELSLVHPVKFYEYEFDISASQIGSSLPVVVFFVYKEGIEIIPIQDNTGITRFKVKPFTGGGGVVSAASVEKTSEPSGGQKCINIFTQGITVTLITGAVCSLNDPSSSTCIGFTPE